LAAKNTSKADSTSKWKTLLPIILQTSTQAAKSAYSEHVEGAMK
jgi:hypothetical protein